MVRNEDFDNLTLNGDNVATGTDLAAKADQDGGGSASLTNYGSIGSDGAHIASQLDIPVYSDDTNAPNGTHYFNDVDSTLKYKDSNGAIHSSGSSGDGTVETQDTGTTLYSDTNILNLDSSSALTVTDNGSSSVTVGATDTNTDTRVESLINGTQQYADTTSLNFDTSNALTATDDGSGQLTIGASSSGDGGFTTVEVVASESELNSALGTDADNVVVFIDGHITVSSPPISTGGNNVHLIGMGGSSNAQGAVGGCLLEGASASSPIVDLSGSWDVSLRNLAVHNSDAGGTAVSIGDLTTGVTIQGCNIQAGLIGIDNHSFDSNIVNNTIRTTSGNAGNIGYRDIGSDGLIRGNIFIRTEVGIDVQDHAWNIVGNMFYPDLEHINHCLDLRDNNSIGDSSRMMITNNMLYRAEVSSIILDETCSRMVISNNRIAPHSSPAGDGIHFNHGTASAIDSIIVTNNIIHGQHGNTAGTAIATTNVSGTTNETRIARNPIRNMSAAGGTTKNSGTTTASDGDTISHRLLDTPSFVDVNTSAAGVYGHVTAMDSSTFTAELLNVNDGSSASSVSIEWSAEV